MPDEGAPARCVSDVVNGSITIFLSVEEGVNLGQTLEKMNKKKSTLEKMVRDRKLLVLFHIEVYP